MRVLGIVMSIEDVKKRHEASLLSIPGVVGVGIGATAGGRVIQVLVQRDTKEVRASVPSTIEGFAVEIMKVGEVRRL